MSVEKTGRIKNIKETISGVVEIMHQIKTHELQESFVDIMHTAKMVKEVIDALKTPEMVKNIENFRLISENINEASGKVQDTLKMLEKTGVINEAKETIKSVKGTLDSFGNQGTINGQDLREMSTSVKEMFKSIRSLVDELRITVAYSKKSITVHDIEAV